MKNINTLDLLSIRELIEGKEKTIENLKVTIKQKDLPFFVDTYQRGYKWGEKEVSELLNDINTFNQTNEESFYCLQPVVIKKEDNHYELIDGQQRCTTIFLILNYLNNDRFSINYSVRPSSEKFLKKLHFKEDWKVFVTNNIEFNNIDNFHFSEAYKIISNWFIEKEIDEAFELDKFKEKFLDRVKVIWYEVNDSEPSQQIFKRINIGKIPLTNADLVKALLSINCDEKVLRQWNEIDLKLKDNKFWWFISNSEYTNRIDYLLELVTQTTNDDNKNSSFIYLENTGTEDEKLELWNKVYLLFLKLVDFEEDIEMYHKLGFAVWQLKYSLTNLLTNGKKDILDEINIDIQQLKDALFNKFSKNDDAIYENLVNANFHFGEDHTSVYNLLYLHNLETHLHICKNQYFHPIPFEQFKNTSWSLEHISPQNIEDFNKQELLDFIGNILEITQDNQEIIKIKSDLEEKDFKPEFFEQIKIKVREFLKHNDIELISEREKHSMVNLCLMDKGLNSSLGNNFFHKKRENINTTKTFVPICSLHIFNKKYTPKPKEFSFWNKEDRANYATELFNKLNQNTND
jgi:uncharacterized protein with ParB-like and HNH nuclease domain